MSSLLCFICHNTINAGTKGDTREKYRDLVGMKLSADSHLCHICCHLLNKLCLFKSICLRRSTEYPVLLSDKGIIVLQNSNTETINLCPDSDECDANIQTHIYTTEHDENDNEHNDLNQYVSLEENLDTPMEVTKEFNFKESEEINDKVDEDHTESELASDQEYQDVIESNDSVEANNDVDETKSDRKVDFDTTKEFHKVFLSLEEQRAELEAKRRENKYLEAEFKCYNCALGFLFKDTYQAHMMRHEESNGEHLCQVCTLRFASAAVLRAHRAAHEERAWCRRCGRPARPRRLPAHAARCPRAARPPRAPCPQCGHSFPDASGLQQHIKRFHLSKTSSKTYSCSVCGKSYNNQAAVRTHMIKHINKKFTCELCPSTFSSPYTLAQHRKRHGSQEEHRCETCNVSYGSRKSLLAHLRNSASHQQTVHPCPVCARECPSARALAAHAARAHGAWPPPGRRPPARRRRTPGPAVCHRCGASFKGNSKLNRHLRSVCEKEKLEEELSALYSQELESN